MFPLVGDAVRGDDPTGDAELAVAAIGGRARPEMARAKIEAMAGDRADDPLRREPCAVVTDDPARFGERIAGALPP